MSNQLWDVRRRAFQQAIREVREKAGLTQSELAGHLKRYQSYVSKYENGEKRLDYIELLDILDSCQITMAAFHRTYNRLLQHPDNRQPLT